MVTTESESRTYDVDQVARLAGVHRSTVYERARAGEVPGVIRIGRKLLFARRAIDAWLEARDE